MLAASFPAASRQGVLARLARSAFPFLGFELRPFSELPATALSSRELAAHVARARYSVRLLRYWWAGQALRREAERLGRPLVVVDLGCERGWLKHFTPVGVVARWVGLDWHIRDEVQAVAAYDAVHRANFDEVLPVGSATADAIVSLHVFEHLPRPGVTMAEVSRLLKPGGIFLGAAPTMPAWVGRLRERYFRRKLATGAITAGGHITVLSPERWKALVHDCGLHTEFVTGSHLLRMTGSRLESSRAWIRLNQLWGALFPSLGSECCIQARRAAAWTSAAQPLSPRDPHWRRAWIGLGAAALLSCSAMLWMQASARAKADKEVFASWMAAHQTGSDHFIVKSPALDLCSVRPDVTCVKNFGELLKAAATHPDAHFLIPLAIAAQLAESAADRGWRVDSRMELRGDDYVMLRRNREGTPLEEYLRGADRARVVSAHRT